MLVLITWQLVFKVLSTILMAFFGVTVSTSLIVSKEYKKLGYASFVIVAMTLVAIWI